uniref:Cytochrome c oxidase assembly protein COX16 homolog, mitochondrial n=1 Tax=Esox lucius TaxID=8010 RepID=C1BWS3_ESOLU|nr:COX16-like protein C14orf112 homolog, mitochondrial precursor [Esox lucius]
MLSFKALQKNKTLKYGNPMLLLIVGGSFGLREFTQIRYDVQKIRKKLDPALEAKVNKQKQSVILEEEYQKMKEVDLTSGRTSGVLVLGRTQSSTRRNSVLNRERQYDDDGDDDLRYQPAKAEPRPES